MTRDGFCWPGLCTGCGNQAELESRTGHSQRALCDACVKRRPPTIDPPPMSEALAAYYRAESNGNGVAVVERPVLEVAEYRDGTEHGPETASDPQTRSGSGTLRFLTPAQLRAETPKEPDWLLENYLAPGVLTIGPARKPKVGKPLSRSRSRGRFALARQLSSAGVSDRPASSTSQKRAARRCYQNCPRTTRACTSSHARTPTRAPHGRTSSSHRSTVPSR
jgi:hypothetical protein